MCILFVLSSCSRSYLSGISKHIIFSTLCPKKHARFNLLQLGQNLTDLQNSFTVRKSMKLELFPDRIDPELIT